MIAQKEPKERILEAAAALFAQRGFSGVGVREIATAADVNISMISYYFNGKNGILKEIIKTYFEEVDAIFRGIIEEHLDPVSSTKKIFREHVNLIRSKPDLCKVAIVEMPFDLPEIAEYKNEFFLSNHRVIEETFHRNKPIAEDPFYKCVIGPAMISLVFSHFLVGHIVKTTCETEFDENFYERYSETISTLFLRGVMGIAEEERKKHTQNMNGGFHHGK